MILSKHIDTSKFQKSPYIGYMLTDIFNLYVLV